MLPAPSDGWRRGVDFPNLGESVAPAEYAMERGRFQGIGDAEGPHEAATVLLVLAAADDVDRATAGLLVQTAPFGAFSRTLASLVGAPPPEASRNAPDLAGNAPRVNSAPAAASGLGKDGSGRLHSFTAPPE